MNVWLLTWEGTDPNITDANRIVGVLSTRLSDSYVERYMELIYQHIHFNIQDIMFFANRRSLLQAQFRGPQAAPGRFYFGKNPFLFARRVKDFKVIVNEENNSEVVNWIEHAVFGNAEKGSGVVEIEPEKPCTTFRPRGGKLMRMHFDT